ncbi:MAG: helix-turn-helix domain-containing protein [Trueperaceae bacterium]
MERQLKNIEYAVKRTGLNKERIYDLCRRKLFPHVRVGRQVLFDAEQIEDWIENGGQPLAGGWRREAV